MTGEERAPTPVVDFHARLGAAPGAGARLLATMDRSGITRAVVTAGGIVSPDTLCAQLALGHGSERTPHNSAVLDQAARSGGRLIPMFFGNPFDSTGAYPRMARRFHGLEISPAVHGLGFGDRRVRALVEVATAHEHPVYAVAIGRAGCATEQFVALARDFPDTTFVLGHCGVIGIDVRSISQIAPYANIVAETSGCYSVVAATAVERLGADRVLFGTEYPLQHPDVELTKLSRLELSVADLAKVAWHNALRILKEPPL